MYGHIWSHMVIPKKQRGRPAINPPSEKKKGRRSWVAEANSDLKLAIECLSTARASENWDQVYLAQRFLIDVAARCRE